MADREKVFDAIRNCITEPKCKDCPWEDCEKVGCKRVKVPVTLMLDVLNVLKEQQETITSLQGTIRKLSAALGEQPEQKRGHWMYGWTCSACNERLRISLDGRAPIFEGIKCCPNCGAKMEAANETD